MKEAKIDVGDTNIKKIFDDKDTTDMKKVNLLITYIQDQWRKLKKSYEYLFTDSNYRVYLINKFEGILDTASPAWCLKTKSMFDSYTTNQNGTQFVLIHEKFVTKDDEILLTVPNTWNERYESGSYAKMRFGITIYPSGRMILFDDNNLQIDAFGGDISNPNYSFLKPLLSRLLEYYKNNIKSEVSFGDEDYDDFKDKIFEIMDDLGMTDCFSEIAPKHNRYDVDEKFKKFYEEVESQLSINKDNFFEVMGKYQISIMRDDDWTQHDGYRDLLVNFMLTKNGISEALPNSPNITVHELPLGGYFFNEQEIGDTAIKYYYGYQYTKYGRAGIEQGFGTLENFYDEVSDAFSDFLTGNDGYLALDIFEIKNSTEFKKEINKCISKEKYKDGYKVTIDLLKLLDLATTENTGFNEYNFETGRHIRHYYSDMNPKDFGKKVLDSINQYFKGTVLKKDNSELTIPICTM
jgi:hypothetical protein